jgi:hypothetical protein
MHGSLPMMMNQPDNQCSVGLGERDVSKFRNQSTLEGSLSQGDPNEDSLQTKKWTTLIQQEVKAYCVEGIDLLKAMKQTEEEELLD